MTATRHVPSSRPGATLIEAAIAIGVLSIAIPLVFGSLGASGKCKASSSMETKSAWIVPACMEEIRASRSSRARFFKNTTAGEAVPSQDDVWVMGFSAEGEVLGKIDVLNYKKGLREISGQKAVYLATIEISPQIDPVMSGDLQRFRPVMKVRIVLEHPASAPAGKREKIEFYTGIP